MRSTIADVMVFAGCASVSAAAFFVSIPLGFVALGVSLIVLGWLTGRD